MKKLILIADIMLLVFASGTFAQEANTNTELKPKPEMKVSGKPQAKLQIGNKFGMKAPGKAKRFDVPYIQSNNCGCAYQRSRLHQQQRHFGTNHFKPQVHAVEYNNRGFNHMGPAPMLMQANMKWPLPPPPLFRTEFGMRHQLPPVL